MNVSFATPVRQATRGKADTHGAAQISKPLLPSIGSVSRVE
jgi:hypothetical protein